MKRWLLAIAAAAALVMPPAAAQAAPSTSTFMARTAGSLAFAQWSLGDQYNTFITAAGNDGMFLTAGAPPFQFTGILFSVNQRFCDTATDENVFRDLSAFVPVSPSAVVVSGGLNLASVDSDVQVSGIEQRAPNCASPDFSNRTVSFPTITVGVHLRWAAPAGSKVTTESHVNLTDPSGDHFVAESLSQGGFVSAVPTGTVTSEDPSITWGPLNTPLVSFLARNNQLTVQLNQCCG